MFRSAGELEGLPDDAVVIDRWCQVWQKQPRGWLVPGSEVAFGVGEVALPARLLDDGL